MPRFGGSELKASRMAWLTGQTGTMEKVLGRKTAQSASLGLRALDALE